MNADPYTMLACFCVFLWRLYVHVFVRLSTYDWLNQRYVPVDLLERVLSGFFFGALSAFSTWLLISGATGATRTLVSLISNPNPVISYLSTAGLVGATLVVVVRSVKVSRLDKYKEMPLVDRVVVGAFYGVFFGLVLVALLLAIGASAAWVFYGLYKELI